MKAEDIERAQPPFTARIVKGEMFTRRDIGCEHCNAAPGQVCITSRYGLANIDAKQAPTEHRVRDKAFAGIAAELVRQGAVKAFPRPKWVPNWAAHITRLGRWHWDTEWSCFRVLRTVKRFRPRVYT